MRPLPLVVGLLMFAMGAVWALQGAYVLPATFMRGPEWIAMGAVVAGSGVVLTILGLKSRPSAEAA